MDNRRTGMFDDEFLPLLEMAEGAERLLESDIGHRIPAFITECRNRDLLAFIGSDGYMEIEEV